MGRVAWVVLTILLLAGAAASSQLWSLTAMLFEAPGADGNPFIWFLTVAAWSVAPFFLAGATLPWVMRKQPWAGRLFILPLVGVGLAFLGAMAVNADCAGAFSCP